MCADSFMTSPSWPVRVSFGSPAIDVASMNRTSPPAPVTASPVATPGTAVRSADSGRNRGRPRKSRRFDSSTAIADRVGGQPGGDLAQHPRQRTLELPDAGLAGVLAGDPAQRAVADRHLVRVERGPLQLPRQQVGTRDRHLVVLGVAVERDDLHAVVERRRDRVGHVGGGQEQHVGQVEVDLEVVVAEGVVLRRVEHLEQRRRRVAAEVRADLVDLVEQHDRVHRAGLGDRPDDAAGQRADVGAPVAADLGLVAHAAEGDADELAAERAGDGLAQRRLADAGRADEREHGARAAAADDLQAALGATAAHGEVLDDAVLHVVEAVVVGVEDLARSP